MKVLLNGFHLNGHTRVSFTDLKLKHRNTLYDLYNIIHTNIRKYRLISFIITNILQGLLTIFKYVNQQ